MDNAKLKPGRQWYVMAGLIFVASIIAFVVMLVSGVMMMVNSYSKQMLVPGEHSIELKNPGNYIVYLEYRTTYNGKIMEAEGIDGLVCTLTEEKSGNKIPLNGMTGNFTYEVNGREGKGVLSFTLDKPGQYTFEAHYENDNDKEVVMAIGESNIGKFLGFIFVSIIIFIAGFFVPIIIVIVVMIKRQNYKSQLEKGTVW